jgi:hypothetical protein
VRVRYSADYALQTGERTETRHLGGEGEAAHDGEGAEAAEEVHVVVGEAPRRAVVRRGDEPR